VGDPGIADLNAFRAFCREATAKNIKVLFSWPAYIRPRLSAGQTLDAPKYMTDLLGEGGMTALDSPADNMYPADFFLDSSYHLTAVGRRIHTEELIRRLRPMLGFAPASGAVKNVLLLAGREHRLTEGNLFAEDPQLEVRYLSKTRLSDPRTVTAEDAAQLVRDGINVFTDSDAAAAVLNAANLGERPSSAGIETIGHWFARHPSNIFMVGNAPGSRLDPAWRKVLPQAIYDGLSRGAIGCAVFGSGRYANVTRLVTGAGSALLQMNTSEVMPPGQHIPAYMEIECVGKESGGPSVRMNVDYLDVGKVNTGCFVVAIDPELGAVADTAVFDSNGQFPAWHLDRVVLEKGER
jgi:hypothetical protein